MRKDISRFIVLLFSCLLLNSTWAQNLYIGGHKAVRDNRYSTWLCSIPQEYFGTDWDAAMDFDSTCTKSYFKGVKIENGDVVTFDSIAGGKQYPFKVTYNGKSISGNITFTWLPLVELNGTFSKEYAEGTVSVSGPDSTFKNNMLAKLKWRGGVTNGTNRHKHNFSIKFLDENGEKKDRRFFGLRKDNHWILDAAQVDLLRARNRVCSDLWLDMSVKPWYSDIEPNAINGSRGKTVEVLLNERYIGIYHMIEPVDRKQLKLVKHDTISNVFHGQLWCNKEWSRTGAMTYPASYSNDLENWESIYVEYPDFDEVQPTDWSTLADAVTFVHDKSVARQKQVFQDSLGYYFDVPVMMDYFIFIVTLQALDNESKNIFYSCYDKTFNPRLTMTPWDLDLTVGGKLNTSWDDEKVKPDQYIYWISHLAMHDMFFSIKSMKKKINNRYWELRESYLDTDSLVARFQRVADELEACGAAAREERRWSGDTDISGQTLDISAEMERVEDWIRQRMAFLDETVFAHVVDIRGDVNDDDEVNIADVNIVIGLIAGQTVDEETFARADLSGDGEINISDLNELIEIIIGN